ncbi:hypothetical protein ACSLUB_02550 [Bordetella hinzii]|uniref:hypothetical protein n=1 Tax=Bordetella hinzii TaxID=103855 RepID=UPI003F1CD6C8
MTDNSLINPNAPGPTLAEMLEMVGDESAKEVYSRHYTDKQALNRIVLGSVYANKRRHLLDDFYDRIYLEHYDHKTLARRPFINFGPGDFRHKYWSTADKIYAGQGGQMWSETRGKTFREAIDYRWDMYDRRPLEIDDGSLLIAYASHIVEHAYDEDNDFFFRDVYRLLAKGGIFRITAPNIDLGLQAAKRKDYSYYGYSQYLKGGSRLTEVLGKADQRLPIEYFVIDQVSLLIRPENSVHLSPDECRSFLWSSPNVYETLDRASILSDRSLNESIGAHVNWFNVSKICRMLSTAGFSTVIPSAYGQSISPVLRDTRYFDKTSPAMSWYVDAVK